MDEMQIYKDKTKTYLDKHSPIEALQVSYANKDALDMFMAVFPEIYWCQDTGVLIVGNDVGTYDEHRGDAMLARIIHAYNEARLEWAIRHKSHNRDDDDSRNAADAFIKHIQRTSELTYEKNVLNTFKLLRQIEASELNKDPEFLGLPNGILDLADGYLLHDVYPGSGQPVNMKWLEDGTSVPYEHEDGYQYKITKHTGAELYPYIEDRTPSEEWLRFIDEITCHDKDLADFLQRAVGYCLIKGNPKAVMFICYGPTSRNGKTVLFNTIMRALGEYSMQVNPLFLCDNKSDANGTNDELARLVGKRMVYMAEPPSGSTLSDTKVKAYTGNDMISTSRKFGPNFTFYPEFTMYMACNELPAVEDNAIFLSDRVIIIPFNRHFTRAERNESLEHELADTEIQMGVLQWIIDGLRKYQERGLEMPDAVRKANEKYRTMQQGTLDRFLFEYVQFDVDSRWETVDFMNTYKGYCYYIEKIPDSASEVTRKLLKKGIEKKKSNGKRYYVGIDMKDIFSIYELEQIVEKAKKEKESAENDSCPPALQKGKKSTKKKKNDENDDNGDSYIHGTMIDLD